MMDETKFIENLIENVKKQRCIYDKSHEFYYNRLVRQKVWKEVGVICNKSENDCKHRWKLLRERFIKEMKTVEIVASNGMVLSEEWKFLQPLMFLKDHCFWTPESMDLLASIPPKKKIRASTPKIDIEIEEPEIKPDLDTLAPKIHIIDQIQSVSPSNQVLPRLEDEQTKVKDDSNSQLLESSKQIAKQDEYQHLCSHWSQKLTKMNNNQRIFAEKLISDVLFNGELNLLNFNTSITNLTPYQNMPIAEDNKE